MKKGISLQKEDSEKETSAKDESKESISIQLVSEEDYKQTEIQNKKETPDIPKADQNSVSSKGISYKKAVSNVTRGEIQYKEKTSGTEILYEVNADKIKESIVFPNKEAVKESYTFQIEADTQASKKMEVSFYIKRAKRSIHTKSKHRTFLTLPQKRITAMTFKQS